MSKGFVRSILFDKALWTLEEAKRWAKDKGYRVSEVEESDRYIRFRQTHRGAKRYRYKEIGKGIKLLLGYNNRGRKTSRKNPGEYLFELVTAVKTDRGWEAFLPLTGEMVYATDDVEIIFEIEKRIDNIIGMQCVDKEIIQESPQEMLIEFTIREVLREAEKQRPLEELEDQEVMEYWYKSKWK